MKLLWTDKEVTELLIEFNRYIHDNECYNNSKEYEEDVDDFIESINDR